jgi:hypothetical protein
VTPLLLALTLGAGPELWVETVGFDAPACDSAALASAIRAQRPGALVHVSSAGQRIEGIEHAQADAILVRLAARGGDALLEVTGAGRAITRTLPAAAGCERSVAIAALIVDGALDDLGATDRAPPVVGLTAPTPAREGVEVGAALGAGIEQGPLGFVAALDAEALSRYRAYELTLDVGLGLPASTPLTVTSPEAGNGTLTLTSLAAELGVGVAPRFGPGRPTVDLLLGASVFFGSATVSPSVFQRASQTSVEFFGGLRIGYAIDLPAGFFLSARGEERFAPAQATFEVVGANPSVATRTWSFQALGLLGYRFL